MPIFEIEGPDGLYEVDAPNEQRAVAAFKKMMAGTGSNVPSSSGGRTASEPAEMGERAPTYGGTAMNATAGINEGLYGIAGAPVDLMRGGMNAIIGGANYMGADLPTIPENSVGGSRWIAETLGEASPVLDPQNTVAENTADRIARGVGQGVGYTVAPEAAVAALARGGVLQGRAGQMAGQVFGRGDNLGAVGRNAVAGAGAGAGASIAIEGAPEGWEPVAGMAGGLVGGGIGAVAGTVPSIIRQGGRVASDTMAPLTASGRERLAGQRLLDAADDPTALRSALDNGAQELVPGSRPTTFQATGDMGIGALERGAQTRDPAAFNARRADQNAARVEALSGIERQGAPERVGAAVRQRLSQIDAETESALQRVTEAARTRTTALGQGMPPESAGDALRASLEAARTQAKNAERHLWDAVDPDVTLTLATGEAKSRATNLLRDLPKAAKPPEGEEAAIFAAVSGLDDVAPFRELTAAQSRIKTEMRRERLANGESPAYRRMVQLNSAIEKDLDSAIAGKVAQEQQAVAAGQMSAENTLLAKAQQWSDEWYARQAEARSINSASAGSDAGGGSTTLLGSFGTESQAGRRLGNAPSNPRLPSYDVQSFDGAAGERLNAARDASRDRANLFDNRMLAPMRRRPASTAPYDMASASVPASIFRPGARGYEAVKTFRQAVGDDEAMRTLEQYAVDRLRRSALRDDGTLDPSKVSAWRKTHADALRAFPDLDRRFADAASASDAMATLAVQRKQALDALEKGSVGKFLGVDHPDDVTATVGQMFGSQDSIRRFTDLRQAIRGDKEAEQGLRKAIADYMAQRFVGNTEAGTSGVGTMKSDGYQNFIRQNRGSLRVAGFSDDEIEIMGRIADDLQRANRSIASVKNPGGSNTAQDTLALRDADQGGTLLAKALAGMVGPASGASAGFMVGNGPGALIGGAGAMLLGKMRQAGIEKIDDLVADALLNPGRARILLSQARTSAQEEALLKLLGGMYAHSMVGAAGTVEEDQRKRGRTVIDITGGRQTLGPSRREPALAR